MATQSVRDSPAGHVISRLGEYYRGVLPVAVESGVEAHLLSCARCLAEYDLLGDAAVVVATLPGDVVAAIEVAAIEGASPPQAPAAGPVSPAGRSGPRRPAGASGPGRPAERGRSRRVATTAATLAVGALIGVTGWTLGVQPWLQPVPVASHTAGTTAARLSVSVTEVAGGIEVSAVVVGLTPGRRFEVLAVGADGRAYQVAECPVAGGPQLVVGTVPLPASAVRFVAAVEDGGGLLLVARLG